MADERPTEQLLRLFVVECRSPGRDWKVYEPCTSESAAKKSLRKAKKMWAEDEWRIAVFVRENT